MKHFSRKAGSLLLMLCLLCALLPAMAFAENYTVSMTANVGSYMEYTWQNPSGDAILLHLEESEYFPDGISISQPSLDCLQISGTPTEAGTFWITSHITTLTGLSDVAFTITVNPGDKSEITYNSSLQAKVGTTVTDWSWATPGGENIGNVYVEYGSLPDGLYIPVPGSNTFQITGTPTTAGSSNCTILVETFDNIFHIELASTIYAAEQNFEVTKSPTSETASTGGSATFIAAATNYNYVDWVLSYNGSTVGTYRSETYTSVNGATLSAYKNDDGREYLVLQNIPSNLNGYTIKARFTNTAKNSSLETQACTLTVKAENLKAPTISLQPSAATKNVGEITTLTVAASDPNNGTLNYQWYSSPTSSTAGGAAISGANQSSYTPPQTIGTTYYYCKVTSTKDGKTSSAVTSAAVAVTYNSASPSPSPSASPSASASPDPAASADPNTSPTASSGSSTSGSTRKGNSTGLLILLIVLILLSAAALIALILYMRKNNASELEEAEASRRVILKKWECPNCGEKNKASSRFCSNCGAANPNRKYGD